MGYVFKGWVPTIAGKLSFSQIGNLNPSSGNVLVTQNLNADGKRQIIAHQQRVTKDQPFPIAFIHAFLNKNKKQQFFVDAQEAPGYLPIPKSASSTPIKLVFDSKARLTGDVFYYHNPLPKFKNPSLLAAKKRVKTQILARNFPTQKTSEPSREHISALSGLLENTGENDLWVHAKFDLIRSGECRIVLQAAHAGKGKGLAELDKNVLNQIADQVFFFIRDLTHQHYHHPEDGDQTSRTSPANGDDYTWRREAMYGLLRLALMERRKNQVANCKNAVGILSYADSFQRHLACWCAQDKYEDYSKRPEFRKGGIPEYTEYGLRSMRTSLEALIKSREWDKTMQVHFWGFGIATIALVLTILTGFFGLYSSIHNGEQPKTSKLLHGLTHSITDKPELLLILLIFALAIFYANLFPNKTAKILPGLKRFVNAFLASSYRKLKIRPVGFFVVVFILFTTIAIIAWLASIIYSIAF